MVLFFNSLGSNCIRITLLLAFVAVPAFAQQCTQKISEMPHAPELLGFHLGMTKEQVKARVPQTVFGRADDFGVSKTTINPDFDSRIDKMKFEGVRSISLDMLDDRLTSLWIGYDETFKVHTVEDFVSVISRSLQVSSQWSSWKSRGQQLRCADFQLIVSTLAGGPTLRVIDDAAKEVVASRRQAKEEQESAASISTDGPPTEIFGDKQTRTYYSAGCQPAKEIRSLSKQLKKLRRPDSN
jgi:hypothetical protein